MPAAAASAAASAPPLAAALAPEACALRLAALMPAVAASTVAQATVLCPLITPAQLAAAVRAACDASAWTTPGGAIFAYVFHLAAPCFCCYDSCASTWTPRRHRRPLSAPPTR
eukprot:gene4811-4558_t